MGFILQPLVSSNNQDTVNRVTTSGFGISASGSATGEHWKSHFVNGMLLPYLSVFKQHEMFQRYI